MAKPTLISLFSGAGGLDYGFEAAGFQTGAAVEMDATCCATLRHNRPNWNVFEGDIANVRSAELLEAAGTKKRELDLVIGGPPCQPFSKAGYWHSGDSRRLEDPRSATLQQYLRIVDETLPRAFLLENVEGLAYADKNEGFEFLKRGVEEINRRRKTRYVLHAGKVNAAFYGVPQLRTRFIVVASREGAPFELPAITHGDPEADGFEESNLLPFTTAWDAFANLPDQSSPELTARGKWAKLLPSIPEGHNYLWHTARGIEQAIAEKRKPGSELFGWRRRYWTFLLKLAKSRPSWTIQAQPGPAAGPFHWDNRRLSARGLSRLQTFPDDIELLGSLTAQQKQAGNAVPSLLAEVVAREIRIQLLGLPAMRGLPKLRPIPQGKPPRPERIQPVPPELLAAYEGKHSEHPGTGEGNKAKLRRLITDASTPLFSWGAQQLSSRPQHLGL